MIIVYMRTYSSGRIPCEDSRRLWSHESRVSRAVAAFRVGLATKYKSTLAVYYLLVLCYRYAVRVCCALGPAAVPAGIVRSLILPPISAACCWSWPILTHTVP